MKARLQQSGLGAAEEIDQLRNIVVYDDFNQPVLIVQKLGEGQLLTTQAHDPSFRKILEGLGIGLNATYRRVGS